MSHIISIEQTFNAPVDRVWRAWIAPSDLSSWLAAKAKVNGEAGGAYELFWEPEHPERNSTLGCRLTALDPMKELAFTWRGPVQYSDLMNGEPPPTHVVVRFEERNGKTLMTFRHLGWGTGSKWEEAKAWQEGAWRGAFEQLATLLESKASR